MRDMELTDDILAFVIACGVIPGVVFLILYGWRTRWWATPTGRLIFWLVVAIVASQTVTLVAEIWSDWAVKLQGHWIRIVARSGIAVVMIWLLRLYLHAAREPKEDDTEELPPVRRAAADDGDTVGDVPPAHGEGGFG